MAAVVDAAAGVALSLALASTAGHYFARRAVVTLRIGEPDTFWQGPIPLILGTVGEVVYLLPFALWLAWALDPLTGATIGKRLTGVRVGRPDGTAPHRAQTWARHGVQTVGVWGWTVALAAGRWEIAALATLAGIIVAVGCLPALGPRRLTLHDRASGTCVVRRR